MLVFVPHGTVSVWSHLLFLYFVFMLVFLIKTLTTPHLGPILATPLQRKKSAVTVIVKVDLLVECLIIYHLYRSGYNMLIMAL